MEKIPNCYDFHFTFVPRFDPVKVHCILPDLPLLNGKERQLDKLMPIYRQSIYKFGIKRILYKRVGLIERTYFIYYRHLECSLIRIVHTMLAAIFLVKKALEVDRFQKLVG
jgi:hypothetical protein